MHTATLPTTSTATRNAYTRSFKRAITNAALLGLALLANPVTSAVAATGQIKEFPLPIVPGVTSATQGIAAGSTVIFGPPNLRQARLLASPLLASSRNSHWLRVPCLWELLPARMAISGLLRATALDALHRAAS